MTPLLLKQGHEVVGLDSDLYSRCTFGSGMVNVPFIKKDIREVEVSDLKGFEAVLHLAALSNDPLGNLNPDLTFDINHRASVKPRRDGQEGRREAVRLLQLVQQLRRGRRRLPRRKQRVQPRHPVRPEQGRHRAQRHPARQRPLLPDVPPQRDRVRRVAAAPVRPGPEQPDGLGLSRPSRSCSRATGPLAADRPHRGHLPGVRGRHRRPARRCTCEAFNVGRTDQNYRMRELAEIVAETVPGCRVEYAADASPDKRCYRVNCDKIARGPARVPPAVGRQEGRPRALRDVQEGRPHPRGVRRAQVPADRPHPQADRRRSHRLDPAPQRPKREKVPA